MPKGIVTTGIHAIPPVSFQQEDTIEEVRGRLYRLQYFVSALSRALTPKDIADIMVGLGVATLQASAGTVWLFDKQNALYLAAQRGYSEQDLNKIPSFRKKGSTATLDAIRFRKPIIIHTPEERRKLYPQTTQVYGKALQGGFIALPLLVEGKVLGAVNFAFPENKILSSTQKEFTHTLTQQCAQALLRAYQYEEEKQAKEELAYAIDRVTALQKVASELATAISPEEMAGIVIQGGINALHAIAGEISFVSEDKRKIRLVHQIGYPHSFVNELEKRWEEVSVDQPLLMMDAISSHKSIYIDNLDNLAPKYKLAKKLSMFTTFKSLAVVPIKTKNKLIGAFALFFNDNGLFQEEDKNFIGTLAEMYAQAVDRARLYVNEEQQNKVLALNIERINGLQSVSYQLSQAITQNEVAQAVVDKGVEILGAQSGEIAVLSEDKKTLKIIAYKGYSKTVQKKFFHKWSKVYSINQSLVAWDVIKNKKPRFISHSEDLPNKYKVGKDFKNVLGYTAIIDIPLIVKGEVLGIFIITFKQVENFEEEDKKFIQTLADQCAQSLDRARVYDLQKKSMLELSKAEARFRSLVENSSDAVVLINKKGAILYSSPSTTRITGYTPEERLQKDVYSYIHPKDRQKAKDLVALSLKHPGRPINFRYRRLNKDGSAPWMDSVISNQLNNSYINAIVVNYRNVNEMVLAEKALKRAKEELEVTLQNIADAVIVWDNKGAITYANQAAAKLNRYSSMQELLDDYKYGEFLKRFEKISDENGRPFATRELTVSRAKKEKSLVEIVMYCIFKKDHYEQWRRVKAAPILDNQGNVEYIVTVAQDITEEKTKERLKDEFISTASHELKTPITSAKLYLELLQERLVSKKDKESNNILVKIDRQLSRLTRLVIDLLDVTKIKSGQLDFKKEITGIDTLVQETIEEFQYISHTHIIHITGKTNIKVFIDKDRMRQVLLNLLSNAMKYSPKATKIDVILKKEKSSVVICIRDYGIGILPENQERIFQPFYRVTGENGDRFPGLGLGLHIASEIIRKHNGKIWVESKQGKGATFCIMLPIYE